MPCAPWFGIHAVSRPSSPQAAAAALVSIGAGATRWFTIVRVVTTSQSSNRCSSSSAGIAEVRGHVGARLLVQQHLVGYRVGEVDHGGQRVVVDVHELDGVLALVGLLGDHDGHRHRRRSGPCPSPGSACSSRWLNSGPRLDRRQVGEVGAGEHGDDPGRRQRGADVDALRSGRARPGSARRTRGRRRSGARPRRPRCRRRRWSGSADPQSAGPECPGCSPTISSPRTVGAGHPDGSATALQCSSWRPATRRAGWRANAASHLTDDRACRAPGRSNRVALGCGRRSPAGWGFGYAGAEPPQVRIGSIAGLLHPGPT